MPELQRVVNDFARAWDLADASRPIHPKYAKNGVGIGPFEEDRFMKLLWKQLNRVDALTYADERQLEVPYPRSDKNG